MKKILFTILLYFITLPVLAENTILIMGDSLSASYGIEVAQGWATLLEKRLQSAGYAYRVVNMSVAGATSSNGLSNISKQLSTYHPQITIIELGGNDGLRGLQINIIKQNLQEMITDAKNAGSKVLLLGVRLPPNYGQQYTDAFQNIYSQLASENQISAVLLFLKGIDDNSQLMQDDHIHPVAHAQIIMLNNVWPVLKELLKK